MRLTLRTLLAYLDDTLEAAESREIGQKLAENPPAREIVDRIKRVTRKRGLGVPTGAAKGDVSDPNQVAQYLSDTLSPEQTTQFELACLESDANLAEVAACHQVLALLLAEQIRVPPSARRRMYELAEPPASLPNRKPGGTIPVGGAIDDGPPGDDHADAAYLMGMSAYSRTESPGVRFGRLAVVGAVASLLVVAVTMAWPRHYAAPREPVSVASNAPPAVTPATTPTAPKPELTKEEILPLPKAFDPPKTGGEPATEPTPKVPATEPTTEPKKEPVPPKEKVRPAPPAPSQDRVVFGQWEKKEPMPILVRQTVAAPAWTRVPAEEPGIVTTDRLQCLPGYKATVRLNTDVAIDFWGNLPDLFLGSPILEASLTPTLPAAGTDADLTLHAGRFFLSTKRAAGAVVRLRFAAEVWDVQLADDKTEVAVELTRDLVPGPTPGVRVSVGLHVGAGRVGVVSATLKPTALAKGDELYWDSASQVSRPKLDADARSKADRSAYWSKFPVFPDASRARASLAALEEFSKKLADPNRVRATFDEALQDKPETATAQSFANSRVAVLMFAALGELNGLADCLTDPNRPAIREVAILGLRAHLASEPANLEKFREVLVSKVRLPEDQADTTVRLLVGLTPAERADPETLTTLGKALASPAVPVRELAFYSLLALGSIDPKDPATRPLLVFDAAGTADERAPAVAAWLKKIEDLKKKMAEAGDKK